MQIDIEEVQGNPTVLVLGLHGKIDGTNYREVINEVKQLYDRGSKYFLLDFSDVNFLSSAGLVSLHSIALIVRGENIPDENFGWDAIHDIERSSKKQAFIKILNPQPKVLNTLKISGMDQYFEIFIDRKEAIDSF